MANINEKNARFASKRKQTTRRRKVFAVLGCVVVIATAAALLVPALSMTRGELTCGFEEHAHSNACYEQVLVCGQEETVGHTHTDACYEKVLACGLEEGEDHTHSDACYEAQLICGQEETEGHTHSAACYEEQLTCDIPEHTHTEACYTHGNDSNKEDEAKMPAVDFEQKIERSGDSAIMVKVKAPEGAFPEGTTMEANLVAANKMNDVQDKVKETIEREIGEEAKVKEMTAVDIVFKDKSGKEIEPAKNVEVKISVDDVREYDNPMLVHVLDKSKESSNGKSDDAEIVSKVKIVDGEDAVDNTMKFESKAFSPYVIVELEVMSAGVITADGETYNVSVSYGSDAGIPEGAELRVEELVEASSAWTSHVELLENELGEEVGFARLFDIAIVDKDGIEIQPAKPVKVKIELDNADELGDDMKVAHFADESDSIDVLDANLYGDTVAFDAKGFSVYAVIDGPEADARMALKFHVMSADGQTDNVVATMYVKKSDSDEALDMIIYDPSIGSYLNEGELFRGWIYEIEDYTVAQATALYDPATVTGAMSIDDIRSWAKSKQPDIEETDPITEYDFYAIILKNYTVQYLDEEGDGIATDTAYMLRRDTEAAYIIEQSYTATSETSHFEGWIIEDPASLDHVRYTGPGQLEKITKDGQTYDLYKVRTPIALTGNAVFNAYVPEGNWLIFDEVEKGATYTAAQFLQPGVEAALPTKDSMSLLGYQFAGWYRDYDPDTGTYSNLVPGTDTATADNPVKITIDGKTFLYAKWVPVDWAPYTVVIWQENLDEPGQYSYTESIRCWGPVGDRISVSIDVDEPDTNAILSRVNNNDADYLYINGQKEDRSADPHDMKATHTRTGSGSNVGHEYTNEKYIGFNCVSFKNENGDEITSTANSVEINPQGNAIVNVYYDRIEYTVKVYFASNDTPNGQPYHVYHYRRNNGNNPVDPLAPWNMDNTYHYDIGNFPYSGTDYFTEVKDGKEYYYTTITARYGEDISNQWPKYVDFPNQTISGTSTELTMISWYMSTDAEGYRGRGSGLNTFKGIITIMDKKILGDITTAEDSEDNVLVARYDEEIYYYTYQIWKEQLEGEDYSGKQVRDKEIGGKTYHFYLDDEFVSNSSASDPKKATQAPTYRGFENLGDLNVQPAPVNHESTCEFYYERIKNPIIYRDGSYYSGNNVRLSDYAALGTDQESDPVYYEASLQSYGKGGANYKTDYPSSYEGFVFEGWYMDAECTTPYPFESTKMPDHSITVYAKFQQVQYRVFLHSDSIADKVPDGVTVYWGDNQAMNFRVDYEESVGAPTGILYDSEGNIYDEYEFGGWYFDPEFTRSFDSDAYPVTDSITSPYDRATNLTDNMNSFGLIDENSPTPPGETGPGYNSDDWVYQNGQFSERAGHRWWITEKLDLYAKWNKNLHESNIEVQYDLNGGTYAGDPGPILDQIAYKDNADAIAFSAPEPPVAQEGEKQEVFRYWVLQTWDEDANEGAGGYVDVEPLEFVSPTDIFTVKHAYAREETVHPGTPDEYKKYTVQLRAEYGTPGEETPTHIYWYSNFDNNDVVKLNDTDAAQNVEFFRINEAVSIKPAGTFTRPGFKFLGWARVNSTDDQGVPLPDEPKLHPELGVDDLFLKYENGKFYAKNKDKQWVEVTQVAADEIMPYHDLYAVWGIDLEIVKTDNGNTPIEGATFDLWRGPTKVTTVDLTRSTSAVVSDLSQGDYRLEETTIPDGYIVTGDVTFKIDANGVVSVTSTNTVTNPQGQEVAQAYENNETDPAQVIVRNKPGTALPNTGGPGTALFYIVGTMIAVLAICIYGFGSRRGRERRSRE